MAKQYRLFTLVIVTLFFGTVLPCPAGASDSLLAEIMSLQLGWNGYVIGKQLDGEQKKTAANNPVQGAYEGTYKFFDDDLSIVADLKTDMVLALYKQKNNADKNELKTMVVDLMGRFGAPTTIAHNKILYWAFNKHGAVSEGDFNKAKDAQQTTELEIIATAKLNSEMEISSDLQKGEDETKQGDPITGTVYFIITSDPLLRRFMGVQP